VLRLLLATTLTGSATALGALPFVFLRDISRRAYDTLLGLGAGLMLAAATLGLLSEALRSVHVGNDLDASRLALVLGGFFAGMLLLLLMDRAIPHEHAAGHHHHMESEEEHAHHAGDDERARRSGLLVLGAMSLHRLPEGFAIGAGFAAAESQALGWMLAVAIAIQNVVEGVVMAAPLVRGGLGRARIVGMVALTGATVPLAALAGFWLSRFAGVLPFSLALGAGALIYLTCSEIIPESHSHGNERRATFGVVVGFVTIILLQTLMGHG
jgi:zinc transporter, ZIP family